MGQGDVSVFIFQPQAYHTVSREALGVFDGEKVPEGSGTPSYPRHNAFSLIQIQALVIFRPLILVITVYKHYSKL